MISGRRFEGTLFTSLRDVWSKVRRYFGHLRDIRSKARRCSVRASPQIEDEGFQIVETQVHRLIKDFRTFNHILPGEAKNCPSDSEDQNYSTPKRLDFYLDIVDSLTNNNSIYTPLSCWIYCMADEEVVSIRRERKVLGIELNFFWLEFETGTIGSQTSPV